ncbi:MAG: biotin/lipoyl-containing protein, partial [Candidatus Tyrphobacter sp.]
MTQASVLVTLPEMGESVTEGSIVEWRKKIGDFVAEGDPLVDVTTDKVDVEVPATASGVITKILADEGATVKVGAALVEIDTSKSANGATTTPSKPAPEAASVASPQSSIETQPAQRQGPVAATPQAQRIARGADLDIARVRGSGPEGLILRGDVLAQRA